MSRKTRRNRSRHADSHYVQLSNGEIRRLLTRPHPVYAGRVDVIQLRPVQRPALDLDYTHQHRQQLNAVLRAERAAQRRQQRDADAAIQAMLSAAGTRIGA